MTPDELAAIEARHQLDLRIGRSNPDVPRLIATVRALRAEVATLRREALLRDAGITTTLRAWDVFRESEGWITRGDVQHERALWESLDRLRGES